jgi:chemotaxis protein MotB
MAGGRRRSGGEHGIYWPAYVDMLSTLLMVFVFLATIFMLAQYFVSQEVSGKDTALARLNRQILELTNLLSLEKGRGKTTEDELAALQATLATLREENSKLQGFALSGDEKAKGLAAQVAALTSDLEGQKTISNEALARVDILNQQLLALRRQIAALNEALEASERKDRDSQDRIKDLGQRLNAALARQVQELQRYRSDFFGRLRELLRDRRDIRVVGDRFVFQSEVLFPSGQAQMTPEGLAAMDQLAAAIVDLDPPPARQP